MSESKAKQLYFQDRSFGLAVLQLIIARLLENIDLARATHAAPQPGPEPEPGTSSQPPQAA